MGSKSLEIQKHLPKQPPVALPVLRRSAVAVHCPGAIGDDAVDTDLDHPTVDGLGVYRACRDSEPVVVRPLDVAPIDRPVVEHQVIGDLGADLGEVEASPRRPHDQAGLDVQAELVESGLLEGGDAVNNASVIESPSHLMSAASILMRTANG